MAAPPSKLRLLLWGGGGRMGQRVLHCAGEMAQLQLLEIAAAPGRGEAPPPPQDWDLLLDFSTVQGSMEALALALQHARPLVCGVTGHSPEQRREFERAGGQIPVLLDANFSPGVALLRRMARAAAAAFPHAAVQLREVHHAGKVDSPSGTAAMLLEQVRAGHGEGAGQAPQAQAEAQVESVREGDVVGEHQLSFGLPEETLRLAHSAHSRDLFARGALRAALWLRGRPPGLYGTEDTLEP